MDLTRQSDIVDTTRLTHHLAIVGAGAIGSFTTLNICKMGYKGHIDVYDADTVEEHNMPNQFYELGSIGVSKVNALRSMCYAMTGKFIEPHAEMLETVPNMFDMVILAVDDMDARIRLYKSMEDKCRYMIDARMGGEIMRIYTVKMNEPTRRILYGDTLYTTAEAEPVRCTAQAVIYNVSVIAGLITSQLKKVILEEPHPFEIVFDLKSMTLLVN